MSDIAQGETVFNLLEHYDPSVSPFLPYAEPGRLYSIGIETNEEPPRVVNMSVFFEHTDGVRTVHPALNEVVTGAEKKVRELTAYEALIVFGHFNAHSNPRTCLSGEEASLLFDWIKDKSRQSEGA